MDPKTPKPQEKGWENLQFHTQPARDVLGTSPKGRNARDFQRTFRGLLGDQKKKGNLMKKVLFRCNGYCFTHLLLFFTAKTNMQKFYMGTSTRRLWDPVVGRPGDQMMGRSGDIPGTSVIHVF